MRRSYRLIFIMEVPIQGKPVLILRRVPDFWWIIHTNWQELIWRLSDVEMRTSFTEFGYVGMLRSKFQSKPEVVQPRNVSLSIFYFLFTRSTLWLLVPCFITSPVPRQPNLCMRNRSLYSKGRDFNYLAIRYLIVGVLTGVPDHLTSINQYCNLWIYFVSCEYVLSHFNRQRLSIYLMKIHHMFFLNQDIKLILQCPDCYGPFPGRAPHIWKVLDLTPSTQDIIIHMITTVCNCIFTAFVNWLRPSDAYMRR